MRKLIKFLQIFVVGLISGNRKNNVPKYSLHKQEEKKRRQFDITVTPMARIVIITLLMSILIAILVFAFVPTMDSGLWYRLMV